MSVQINKQTIYIDFVGKKKGVEDQIIEMIFDYQKRDWMLSSPQQEAVKFEDSFMEESLLRIETIEFALKYIKENLL